MFIRFTYVEFSWDVMEPISYFVGLANVIMGYIYFMFTQRDFSFGTWQSQMMQNAMDRQLKTGKFDVEKYEQMAKVTAKVHGSVIRARDTLLEERMREKKSARARVSKRVSVYYYCKSII